MTESRVLQKRYQLTNSQEHTYSNDTYRDTAAWHRRPMAPPVHDVCPFG